MEIKCTESVCYTVLLQPVLMPEMCVCARVRACTGRDLRHGEAKRPV